MLKIPYIVFIIVLLLIYSCKENNVRSNYSFCVSHEVKKIIRTSQELLDDHLTLNYGNESSDIKERYIEYLKSWDFENYTQLKIDSALNSNKKKQLILNRSIKDLYDFEQNLGDTVEIFSLKTRKTTKRNNLIFNYKGDYANCLRSCDDTIGTQYINSIESIGTMNKSVLAYSLIKMLEKDEVAENQILNDIIVLEFYLEPLIRMNIEK